MTLQKVLIEMESLAKEEGYKQRAYEVQAARMRKLIRLKGADCLVSNVSIEEVNEIKIVDFYA